MSNRLAGEQSPYLLQHKDNPVDWFPWGEEAFSKARRENRPIFLSIGYSTCHWCHVMEHESFEDEEVARLMNEVFVSIKVDREERPDIDALYMTVCQMMTGHGGWPLTVVMTPEKKPFFAGTYLPREGRMGRLGMLDLVPRIRDLWAQDRQRIEDSAQHITEGLQAAARADTGRGELDPAVLAQAYEELRGRFDPVYGGFGSAPKFPSPHNLLFLLRRHARTGEPEALEMVTHTLERMRLGGIFDQVGGGFHRYSTDRMWHLPHFEKMLYDQALLILAYAEAFQVAGDPLLAETVRETAAYLRRDLSAPEGAFYCAEDADSEGREGKFYVWTVEELREALGDADGDFAAELFQVEERGNFEEEATRHRTGENILHPGERIEEAAARREESPEALRGRVERILARLAQARAGRVRPGLDDKVLTDWNGLAIAALASAARALGDDQLREMAVRAEACVRGWLWPEGDRLRHRYRAGEAGIEATLDDYAYLAWGELELYELTFDAAYLERSLALTSELLERFWDGDSGGFFLTPIDGEPLLVRQKEFYDGALPSGNAIGAWTMLRLARMTGRTELEERALDVLRAAAAQVRAHPSGYTGLLIGADFALGATHEVVVAGRRDGEETRRMLALLHERYLPHAVLLFRPEEEAEAARIVGIAPFVEAQRPIGGEAAAYVCTNQSCEAPTTDPEEMLRHLNRTR